MEFTYSRTYVGPVKAVILDWAGTALDYGSFAPTAVFLRLFESRGVPITMEEARAPMGLMKRDHLRAILQMESVAVRWQQANGRRCTAEDVDTMFQDFVPMQMACLTDYAEPIPGIIELANRLHQRGIVIGSTTGYTRDMMEILAPEAERRGYRPDAWVCPSDVPAGRPHPWMIYQNAIQLQVYPMQALVKIGDTLPDIEEGLNAGSWTIGLTLSGNGLGLTQEQATALPADALAAKRQQIAERMRSAGAHYTADGIWDCYPIITEIEQRLRRGERP